MSELRPYQTEAIGAVLTEWESVRSTLLVAATGTGKTRIASEVIAHRAREGRVLWIAHRDELITQAKTAIEANTGLQVGIEKAERRANLNAFLGGVDRVVVASVQTMHEKRRGKFEANDFATIIVDEAHHSTAKSYRAILEHFPRAKILGVTATPDRGDKVGLGQIFETVAYRYEIRRGIEEGYLSPIIQRSIECADLDLSTVRTTAGDLNQGDLDRAMRVDSVLHQIASPLVREAGSRPTIVFTASVEHAHALADVLAGYTSRGIRAIDGTTPEELRRRYLAEFQAGEVQYVINCAVLTEGFDAPLTACVAVARPTKSRSLYAQMIGRGTRTADGKLDCLILDFRGNAGRHTLVTPLEVLAGKPIPPDIMRDAVALADGGTPTAEALAEAEKRAIERAEADRIRRETARKKLHARVQYRATQIDPFGCLDPFDTDGPRATPGQVSYLHSLGVEWDGTPSRREASRMLDELSSRKARGLCTYKQARLLARYGLSTDLTFDEARAAIDAIAANGWKKTPAILATFGPGQHEAPS